MKKIRKIVNKNVVVTGASGFIGSHLTETLVKTGAKVKAFVHYNSRGSLGLLEFLPKRILKSVEIIQGDIQDPFSVKNLIKGSDIVFHLAALIGIPYSYVSPQSYVSTNVKGTLNVLEACREYGVERLIHTSTSETYGTALYTPIDEKHPLQGQSPYSASKISADKLVESYYLSFGLPTTTIRPFNNFGPRQSARAIIPTIIIQALTQPAIKLGSLSPYRDFLYVEDTVNAFIKAAMVKKAIGCILNVGTGITYSIGEVVEMTLNTMNLQKQVVQESSRVRPKNSEVMKLVCDYSFASETLDWEPKMNLEQGLAKTSTWIKNNILRYKTNIYNI